MTKLLRAQNVARHGLTALITIDRHVILHRKDGPCTSRSPRALGASFFSLGVRAFGEGYQPSLVDRFGVWLSARQIRRYTGPFVGKEIGDIGCGYNASFVRSVLPEVDHVVLVDLSLSPELKHHPESHCGRTSAVR